jgi:hypothetical protein
VQVVAVLLPWIVSVRPVAPLASGLPPVHSTVAL